MAKETLVQSSRYSLFLCRPGARLGSCRSNRNTHVHLCKNNIIMVESGIFISKKQLETAMERRKFDQRTKTTLLDNFNRISANIKT